jgi:hypothetical protein
VVKKFTSEGQKLNDGQTVPNSEDVGLPENPEEERLLPIVHFANEKEDDQMYGNTEYQNIYALMANYHAVLDNAIKNNIYNSNAVPVFQGIKDMQKFLEANGEKRRDGSYRMKWNADQLILGGEGFEAKILSGIQNAADADKILNLLFWLISQGSETPEFVFGTAVQSSKASVEAQMPVIVKKAKRKQTMLDEPMKELLNLYFWNANRLDNSVNTKVEFEVKWPEVVGDDLNVNLSIVTALDQMGLITNKTKMMMLEMGKYVPDFQAEIKAAQKEHDILQQKQMDEAAQLNGTANPAGAGGGTPKGGSGLNAPLDPVTGLQLTGIEKELASTAAQ